MTCRAEADLNLSEPVKGGRGRPRSEDCRSAILRSAADLLLQRGLRHTTAEAIAQQAGVSKATLYKWWPNKNAVALEAFLHQIEADVRIADTGNFTDDFRLQLRAAVQFYTGPHGQLFTQLVSEAQHDPAFAQDFAEKLIQTRRTATAIIWQRGLERREVRDDIDPDVAFDLIFGPMVSRLLTRHAPLSEAVADQLVSAALGGLLRPAPAPDTSPT